MCNNPGSPKQPLYYIYHIYSFYLVSQIYEMCNTFHPLLYNYTGCIYCTSYVILFHLIFIPALLVLSSLCTTCCVYSSQLLYIAIPPCIYFLYFLDRCAVLLYCFCVVLYILCKHIESHFTKSNSLFVQTYLANKRDSD